VCGIAGFIGRQGELANPTVLARMCGKLVHRGPDDEGRYTRGHVGIGIRRLSVIDLAGGHQPIHNEDETVWAVLNGEIYNFGELREDLVKRGHHFYTHADSEVIVHLYEEMGRDFIRSLRGMFAIALYDERNDSLLLVRDRLGKKPLYYSLKNERLWFASEIKAILAGAPELQSEIDPAAILQFLTLQYIPDPNSAFKNISKLPPGYTLEYSRGKAKVSQYWDFPAYGTNQTLSEEECLEQLEERLTEAVLLRLISDVPLGALLSGGVDSSVVVALMARATDQPVKTFTIGFGKQDFNEAPFARAVSEKFGTFHHEFTLEPDVTDTLMHLTRIMDEPFGDSSIIPTYHACRIAREHVTVALTGDGGDELFAGYDRYPVHLSRMKYEWIPEWFGRAFRKSIYPLISPGTRGRRFLFNISLPPRERYLDSVSYLPAERERRLFTEDFLAAALSGVNRLDDVSRFFDEAQAPDRISRLLYMDSRSYLTGDVLAKVDRMSMASSLEVRCPILDHVVVEWVSGLPTRWKYRGGVRKYLLKKLAHKLGVPGLERPKQGFAMPLNHWWQSEFKDDLLPILLEPKTIQRGYLNRTAVQQLVNEHQSRRRDHAHALWLLLVLELWHRNFLESLQDGAAQANGLQTVS
jgi:asparagine synthase (glutamine-hydrolysing)